VSGRTTGGDREGTLRVGLTGNIGSGKSTVAALLAKRGAAVIDADALARTATEDRAVRERIARDLGPEFVTEDGIDRPALAALVFEEAEARRRLEAIIHPWVRAAAAAREAELIAGPRPPVIVHDVPLLFESGLDADMDATVVVTAPLETRIDRVARRRGLDERAVRARDAAQLPLAVKAERATFVVDNAGRDAALVPQVAALWEALMALRANPERRKG
jgi:dephospho-CoA kinase